MFSSYELQLDTKFNKNTLHLLGYREKVKRFNELQVFQVELSEMHLSVAHA